MVLTRSDLQELTRTRLREARALRSAHLDTQILVDTEVVIGRRVIEALDDSNIHVSAGFWFQDAESYEWRLVIATRLVSSEGPKKTYKAVQTALRRHKLSEDIPLWRISLVGPKHPLVSVLSSVFVSKGMDLGNVRLDHCVIKGVPVEGAHIYRLIPVRSRRRSK